MMITLEMVRDEWRACYNPEQLALLYDRPMSAVEVLTRKDGKWATVPIADRIWTVCRVPVMGLSDIVSFAQFCAAADDAAYAAARSARSAYADAAADDAAYAGAAGAYAAYAAARSAAYAAYAAARSAAYADAAGARQKQIDWLVQLFEGDK